MKKAELNLRHRLRDAMNGLWLMTWHEDGHVNPGVPDVSFVMREGNCETGWMELKAEHKFTNGRVKFEIRQSQIDWILKHHARRIPVFMLVAVDNRWWLVGGSEIKKLVDISEEELYAMTWMGCGTLDTLRDIATTLTQFTLRE